MNIRPGRCIIAGRQGKTVRFRLELELLHSEQELAVLQLELPLPDLVLGQAVPVVPQPPDVVHGRLEDASLVLAHVPEAVVIPLHITLRL